MENRSIVRRGVKRRHVNSSLAVQNQSLPRKLVIILDDTWLEALKHLTCLQWSKIGLVCCQINRIVQRNMSRLPRQVIEKITITLHYLLSQPRFTSVSPSFQQLCHPASYIKNITMRTVNKKLIDANFNGEELYIRCQTFVLLSTSKEIAKSLEWLERNVRSESISLPEWLFNKIPPTCMLTNFIFDSSQRQRQFSHMIFLGFLALPVVQSTIPTIVIDHYPEQEEYRAYFGKNLIGQEVDSQGADALYVIENGDKRIRISFCRRYPYGNRSYKAYLKFYAI